MTTLFHPRTGDSWHISISGKSWTAAAQSLRWHGGHEKTTVWAAATPRDAEQAAATFSAELLAQDFVVLEPGRLPSGFAPYQLWAKVAQAPEPGRALRALWGSVASKGGPAFEATLLRAKAVTVTADGLQVALGAGRLTCQRPYAPLLLEESDVPEEARAMLELHASWKTSVAGSQLQLGLDVGPAEPDEALKGTPLADEPVCWVMQQDQARYWLLHDAGEGAVLYPYRMGEGLGTVETASLEAVFFREVAALDKA